MVHGSFGYARREAVEVASDTVMLAIGRFSEMRVHLDLEVLWTQSGWKGLESLQVSRRIF